MTSASLIQEPGRAETLTALVESISSIRSARDGRKASTTWLPASCFVPGGVLAVAPLAGEADKARWVVNHDLTL